MSDHHLARRRFLLAAGAGVAGIAIGLPPAVQAAASKPASKAAQRGAASAMLPLLRVSTDALDIAYYAAGPEEGRPVVLLHDIGYGIDSYAQVAQLLAKEGFRVLVPQLRGHGETRFNDAATPRSGQQAALGKDAIDLIDALHMPEAVFAGFGAGATAACAAAVLKPTRCVGVVTVGGYQLNDPARTVPPLALEGLKAKQRVDNPDFVEVVTHAYRHRMGEAAGDPRYSKAEDKLTPRPAIGVPTITLTGTADGAVKVEEPGAGFSGAHSHRVVNGAGYDLPHDAPGAFADAVAELVRKGKWRT